MERPKGTNSAKVIQVIETKTLRGLGIKGDPVREVIQYWDFKGNFWQKWTPIPLGLVIAQNGNRSDLQRLLMIIQNVKHIH